MVRVSSTEFQRQSGRYCQDAHDEPVIITSHGRDRLVLMSMHQYEALNRSAEVSGKSAKLNLPETQAIRETLRNE